MKFKLGDVILCTKSTTSLYDVGSLYIVTELYGGLHITSDFAGDLSLEIVMDYATFTLATPLLKALA
jgi:hypothetical protein